MTIISSLLNVLHYCSCFYRHNKVSGIVLALPATPKSMELSLLSPPRQSRCNCPCFSPPHQSRWNCPCFLRHTKVGGISLLSPPHQSRWNCPCSPRHTKVSGLSLLSPLHQWVSLSDRGQPWTRQHANYSVLMPAVYE